MKKHIIIILILLLLIPALAYSGFGLVGEAQPDHERVCKNWKKGDEIPGYLLKDNSKYNNLSLYTPAAYIKSIDNVELLWALLFHPEIPDSNFHRVAYHLLDILGVKDFGKTLKKRSADYSNDNLQELRSNFNDNCFKIYCIFIRNDNMPYEEAAQVLEKMKKDIMKDKDVQKVYREWWPKYECINEEGYTRTKIGNGGHFYFSVGTKKIFPGEHSRALNKKTISELCKAKEGDLIIVKEYMHEDDKKLRARLGKIVATDTEDRMSLYIILEET